VVTGTNAGGTQGAVEKVADLLDVGAADKGVEGCREDGVDEEAKVRLGPVFRRSLLQ